MARRSHERQDDEVDPAHFSPSGAAYNPERDGSLESYLKIHDGGSSFPLFYGIDHFRLLKENGWLAPRLSIIRLMWNVGREDEHFEITENWMLEGIESAHHGGRPGIHRPENVLQNGPTFEAHRLWGPAWHKMHDERMRSETETE